MVLLLTPFLLFAMAVASAAGTAGIVFGVFLGAILLLMVWTTHSVLWSVRLGDQLLVRRTFHSQPYELTDIRTVTLNEIHSQLTLFMGVKSYRVLHFSMKDGTRWTVLRPDDAKMGQLKELLAKHQVDANW